MATLSTHVLDTTLGRPAQGVAVRLTGVGGEQLDSGTTDDDGRIARLGPEDLPPGDYELTFDTGGYHEASGQQGFYPRATVTFTVAPDQEHYHVPLVLNPWSWSTYRGS